MMIKKIEFNTLSFFVKNMSINIYYNNDPLGKPKEIMVANTSQKLACSWML